MRRSPIGLSCVCGLLLAMFGTAPGAAAQGLPDPERAKALAKCHIVVERAGAKLAVKKLKSLAKCVDGVFKCLQTKPGVPRCLEQARERCEEQLRAGRAEEATLVDAVVRKCGSDLTVDDLLAPAGLDVESLRVECEQRFGIALVDLAAVGTCLARQQACELERLFTVAAPRAATLLATAGVDPAARAALPCLTDYGGSDEHVDDPRHVGRPLTRCARAIENAGLKLVDGNLKAVGRCLDTLFTCVQVKTDPAAAPACLSKAQKRCDLELANVAAAATRPAAALRSACGALDYAVLRSDQGLRLALDGVCEAAGAGPASTLAAYADCLTRTHRCGVRALARFTSPRGETLLAGIGKDLETALCPSLAAPTPPAETTTPTPVATPTPLPGCADAYEPNAFPDTPANLNAQCGGTCTDDGFDLLVLATIDHATDGDFYVFDVVDLPAHTFSLNARLSTIPDDTNYDLYLYRLDGSVYVQVDDSTNNGTGSEAVSYDGNGSDDSGRFGVEVRRVSGSACSSYRLEIEDPS